MNVERKSKGCPPGMIALCACVLIGGQSAAAQSPALAPPKRTELQRTDVATAAAQETILATVDITPGTGNAFHTHPGTEMAYVVSGRLRLEIKGQPSRELQPGDSFLIPRGVIHRSVLIGTVPVKLVNTWTLDKGKPLMTVAPD